MGGARGRDERKVRSLTSQVPPGGVESEPVFTSHR